MKIIIDLQPPDQESLRVSWLAKFDLALKTHTIHTQFPVTALTDEKAVFACDRIFGFSVGKKYVAFCRCRRFIERVYTTCDISICRDLRRGGALTF